MFKRLNDNKIFEFIYIAFLGILTFFCWDYFALFILGFVIILSGVSIILFDDFKYMIPTGLFFIISNREGYHNNSFPIGIIICFIIFAICFLIYLIKKIKNKEISFKNIKSWRGLLLLSISTFIPIFWYNIIPKGFEVMYLVYLSYLLYFVIYFIYALLLNKNSFRMLVTSIIVMAIIVVFEEMVELYTLKVNYPSLDLKTVTFYSLGWGCSNEAGILLLMALPFCFIYFLKFDNWKIYILNFLCILFIGVGVLLTLSRGTYLIGFIELATLCIYALIKSKNKIVYSILIGCSALIFLITIQLAFGIGNYVKNILINGIFIDRLNDNNRFELWKNAYTFYSFDFVRMTFGTGFIAELSNSYTRSGVQLCQIVYHSTLFEMMVVGGNLGIAFLIIHFIDKYKGLRSLDKSIFGLMLIGYLFIDMYGFIDNTYGMYYYMIVLVIIMASIDSLGVKNGKSN